MRCPDCFSVIPDTAIRCECGREFTAEEISAVQAVLRRQAVRARRRRAAVACAVLVLLLLAGWVGLRFAGH